MSDDYKSIYDKDGIEIYTSAGKATVHAYEILYGDTLGVTITPAELRALGMACLAAADELDPLWGIL